MSNLSNKVKIFHRINKLKLKAGVGLDDERIGYIDPKAVRNAQQAIDEKEKNYTEEVEIILAKLDSTWDDLKAAKDDKEVKKLRTQLYNYANNIKDMADTFGYRLMDHFGESLRDFCEKLDMSRKEHHVIVQAHIDVMWVTFHENIKDHGGPKAEELKKIVAVAIEKYS